VCVIQPATQASRSASARLFIRRRAGLSRRDAVHPAPAARNENPIPLDSRSRNFPADAFERTFNLNRETVKRQRSWPGTNPIDL